MSVSRRLFLQRTGVVASGAALRRLGVGSQTSGDGADLTLVKDGKSTYAIVVLPEAPVAAQHGAMELQQYLRQMSGATLPLLTADDMKAGRLPNGVTKDHTITLGGARPTGADADLPDDGFLVQTRGTALEINGGGSRGTLYGCYALLENILGVRWFTTDCTVVPSRSTVTVSALHYQDAPAFEYRFPFWEEAFDRDWALHNRCNALADGCRTVAPNCPAFVVRRVDPSVGSAVQYGHGLFVHSFVSLVPPKAYPNLWQGGSLCTSDPAAVDAAVKTLRQLIPSQPEARLWSISQPDTADGYCKCASCQQIVTDEGAQSGPLIHFVNAIADRLGPVYPNVLFDTLAYGWSEAPPKKVRARDNVCIRFAPIHACVAHPLGTCDQNRDAYTHFVDWSKIAKHLYVWSYDANFTHFLQPLPNITSICANIATYHRLGATGLFAEGYYAGNGGGSLGELKAYLVAKLTWNPAQDSQALINDYLHGVYGAGAPYIRQWIDAIEAEVSPSAGHGDRHAVSFDPTAAPYITSELMARGTTFFDGAERAAAADSGSLDRIRKARLSLTYLQMLHSAVGSADRTRYLASLMAGAGRYHIVNPRN